MFILGMLGALGVSTVVLGGAGIVSAAKNSGETKRKDRERLELWQKVVANVDGPTKSQLHLKAVKEDNERTELSMGEAMGIIFGTFDRSSKKNLAITEVPSSAITEVSSLELSPAEAKATS